MHGQNNIKFPLEGCKIQPPMGVVALGEKKIECISRLMKVTGNGGGCCFHRSFYYSEIHTFQACFFLISLISNYEGEEREIHVETKGDE